MASLGAENKTNNDGFAMQCNAALSSPHLRTSGLGPRRRANMHRIRTGFGLCCAWTIPCGCHPPLDLPPHWHQVTASCGVGVMPSKDLLADASLLVALFA